MILRRCQLVLCVLVVTLIGCQTVATAPTQFPKNGCSVVVSRTSSSAFYEPVTILAERDGVNEDGQPVQEWWVYYPQRPHEDYLDTAGQLRGINVPKHKILIGAEARLINGMLCKCPW